MWAIVAGVGWEWILTGMRGDGTDFSKWVSGNLNRPMDRLVRSRCFGENQAIPHTHPDDGTSDQKSKVCESSPTAANSKETRTSVCSTWRARDKLLSKFERQTLFTPIHNLRLPE